MLYFPSHNLNVAFADNEAEGNLRMVRERQMVSAGFRIILVIWAESLAFSDS